MSPKRDHRTRTRIMAESAHAALGGARGLTSHIKCLYDQKYCNRYRLPRIVFSFDALLVALVLSLVFLLLSLWMKPVAPPTITASLYAPSIIAAKKIPLALDIRTTDKKTHENVRITWHLPPGVEVLSSSPPMNAQGTVFIGTVSPGENVASHIVTRILYPSGSQAHFAFTIESDEGGERREYVGGSERVVVRSALHATVPEAFLVDAVPPEGAVIPIAVQNTGDLILPSVELRSGDSGSIGFPRIRFGDLQPGEQRFAFVRLGTLSSPPSLSWSVFSASRELEQGTWSSGIRAWPYPAVTGPLLAHPGMQTTLHITASHADQSVLVVQPLWEQSVQTWPLANGINDIRLPAIHAPVTPVQEWFVFPVRKDLSGRRELGPGVRGLMASSFPLRTSVRYVSEAGDQLGLGPHPPRVGRETRYWVFWKIGPFDGDVKNIRLDADLSDQVRATGLVAAPHGGTWSVGTGSHVSWRLDAFGAGAGLTEAEFGFEITLVPAQDEAGRTVPILGETRATAQDSLTGTLYDAVETAQNTDPVRP